MKLVEALKLVAPKLEGNMKVTKTDHSIYSVKCYGEDAGGDYITLTASVEGNISETDFDIFNIKVSNGVEEDLDSKEILEFFCNGSVDPTGVEDLEIGHSMIFELF
jgi:hypothetical protein